MRTIEKQPWQSIVVRGVFGLLCAVMPAGYVNAAAFTYQIDSGTQSSSAPQFNNTLGVESTSNQAEDNWVANTFTAQPFNNVLGSITWFTGVSLSNLPSGATVTGAIYSGTPSSGLTLVATTSPEAMSGFTDSTWETVSFATPVHLTAGQQFTAALLIDNVPNNAFVWSLDNSGASTNGTHSSYFDVSNPAGTTGVYNLASPNFPTLNGATYSTFPAGSTNASAGITLLRVETYVPEPSSIGLALVGLVAMCGCGVRRRRPA